MELDSILNEYSNKNSLLIIDGDNYFYRLYSIHSSLLKKEMNLEEIGMEHLPIILNKTLNTFNSFSNLIKYNHYNDIFFTFDKKGSKKSNSEILKEINQKFGLKDIDYKGQRKRNDVFIEYKRYIQNILYLKGYFIFSSDNYEADDIIVTLVNKLTIKSNSLLNIDILSTDKDLYQLLNENVKIIKGISKKDIENKISFGKYKIELFNKFGLKLNKAKDIIYLKAIVGDKSDNIMGVKGIAEKTLAKELNNSNNNIFETEIYKKNKELIDAYVPLIKLEQEIKDSDIGINYNKNVNDNKTLAYINKIINT